MERRIEVKATVFEDYDELAVVSNDLSRTRGLLSLAVMRNEKYVFPEFLAYDRAHYDARADLKEQISRCDESLLCKCSRASSCFANFVENGNAVLS